MSKKGLEKELLHGTHFLDHRVETFCPSSIAL